MARLCDLLYGLSSADSNRIDLGALPSMTDSNISIIQSILNDVDEVLRERLKGVGIQVHHIIVVIAPDGTGIVRSNVGPPVLSEMAELLDEIAEGATARRPDHEPLN